MKSKDQIFIFLITISVIFTSGLFIYGTSNPKPYVEKPSYRIGEVTEQQKAEAIDIALNDPGIQQFLGYYVFTWDRVPGNDSERERFLNNLSGGPDMSWVKTAPTPKIEKIDNGNTIKIFTEKHNAIIRLNNKKTNVTVDIDNHSMWYPLFVKTENGNLNVYSRQEELKYYIEDVYHTVYYDACNQSEKVHKPRYDLTEVVINFIPYGGVRLFVAVDLNSKTMLAYAYGSHPSWVYPECIP